MTTAAVLVAVLSLLSPQADMDDIVTFTLDNGMKIIVHEDHSIPNANMYFFYKVGSRNEYPGITGLSHFFEHMMFNGAEKYGFKQFDRVMEAAGGSNNAYTTENTTVYTDWFPKGSMELIFDLEADRIANLALRKDIVESERGVIHSEWTTGRNNSNWQVLGEQVTAAAMIAHPYSWSVVGWESDILNWKQEDLQKYFDTYYAPNNCVVVISGDVELEEVKRLTKQYFEPIPANDPPREIHTEEPPQMGEKRLEVEWEVFQPNILIAFHVPETGSPDYYALDLLDTILSDGRTSRFYKRLVDEKQLAIAAVTHVPMAFDPFLYYIYAISSGKGSTDDIEAEIYDILDDIKANGVTDDELQKAKNIKLMQFYHAMETINGKSNTIGTYELFFGDYGKLFSAPEDYGKVTSDDIKRVAAKYFVKKNRTVGIMRRAEEE
ncbi:MAG TPA: pitrilysin family protein [Acidobacteriota bacterium]|nr:pitrilysin family protein [Acidobacteriota bacterium]